MPLPERIAPMKAVSGELPLNDEGWAYEVKWDGMRVVAYIDGKLGTIRLETTNRIDATVRFPEVAALPAELSPHQLVLDGELVAFDDKGRPSFGRLQQRMHIANAREAARRAATVPVCYQIFDLLHLDDNDLTGLQYVQRRQLLAQVVEDGPFWRVPPHHVGEGVAMLDAAMEQGLEGLLAKRADSRYEPGRRSPAWRKVKVRRRQEFVVGGWHPGEKGREGRIGSLLVGYHDTPGGPLRYAGKVGTGFTDTELDRLGRLFAARATPASPFEPPPPRLVARTARWVLPDLVAEVAFGEWTPDGILRHPSYLGQRVDKDPADVVREP